MTEAPSIPEQIAKYRIEKILGQGAMGVVYKGSDIQIERPVAVKVLHEHLRQGDQSKELENRFLQEAKAAARCLHPNIVTIFDFGTHEGNHFIVMEYVEGIELKAHLKGDTPISLASAADITIQVLEALHHAHNKGIVHRDIKPANIILLEDGTVKVSDFGVARLDTSDLTHTGFMIGTPNYMSPEGLQGEQVDQRSDLYSVGVLFYELLTRRRPLKGVSLDESIEQLDMVPHLSVQNIQSIKPILMRALQPLSDVRFQSAAEFIKRLRTIDDLDLTEAETAFFPTPAKNSDTTIFQATQRRPDSPSVSQWNDELLTSLERSLAQFVGPMARVLVKKNSTQSTSLEELSARLAEHIPNQAERQQFLQRLERTGISAISQTAASQRTQGQGSQGQPAQGSAAAIPLAISDGELRKITSIMAFFVGPLASRLVKQTRKKASDYNELISQLAIHIPDPAEQQDFLARVRQLRS